MIFNSIDFLLFFSFILLGYWIVPRKGRYLYLLFASYIFYMGWNPRYALLILFSTVATWASSMVIAKFERGGAKNWKKIAAVACIVFNLVILAYFKYFNFLLDNINAFLEMLQVNAVIRKVDIILPVGISFYTFQAFGYTLDVYRGEVEVEENFFKYALFVSFFPQLVAGPIERTKNLMKQITQLEQKHIFDFGKMVGGFVLILWGLFQKMVIADRIAIIADTVFDTYWQYEFFGLFIGMLAFAIQIYCDFASYSMIAVGAAKIMGFELMENFNVPYMARSISEFWRRWHISLSSWLRDYIYIPLGGNRCSKTRNAFNTMVTFLISGLWHGANWTYIAWGGVHACYLIVGSGTLEVRKKIRNRLNMKQDCLSFRLGQRVVTFALVSLAWIIFRSATIADAMYYMKRMLSKVDMWSFSNGTLFTLGLERPEISILLFGIILLIAVDLIRFLKEQMLDEFLEKQNLWFRWFCILLLLTSVILFGVYGPGFNPQQFIYFQF